MAVQMDIIATGRDRICKVILMGTAVPLLSTSPSRSFWLVCGASSVFAEKTVADIRDHLKFTGEATGIYFDHPPTVKQLEDVGFRS